MDLTQLSLTELKAIGFDLYNQIAVLQQNMQILNQQIEKREKEAPASIEPIPPAPAPFPPALETPAEVPVETPTEPAAV
jgi:hypothetical protein